MPATAPPVAASPAYAQKDILTFLRLTDRMLTCEVRPHDSTAGQAAAVNMLAYVDHQRRFAPRDVNS